MLKFLADAGFLPEKFLGAEQKTTDHCFYRSLVFFLEFWGSNVSGEAKSRLGPRRLGVDTPSGRKPGTQKFMFSFSSNG